MPITVCIYFKQDEITENHQRLLSPDSSAHHQGLMAANWHMWTSFTLLQSHQGIYGKDEFRLICLMQEKVQSSGKNEECPF